MDRLTERTGNNVSRTRVGTVKALPYKLTHLSLRTRPDTKLLQTHERRSYTTMLGVAHVRTNDQAHLQLLVRIRNPQYMSTTRMNAKQTLIVQESKANGRLKRLHLRDIGRKCSVLLDERQLWKAWNHSDHTD